MASVSKFVGRYQPIRRATTFALLVGTLWMSPARGQSAQQTLATTPSDIPDTTTLMRCAAVDDATTFGAGDVLVVARCDIPLVPLADYLQPSPVVTLQPFSCKVWAVHVETGVLPLSPQPTPEPVGE